MQGIITLSVIIDFFLDIVKYGILVNSASDFKPAICGVTQNMPMYKSNA